MYCTDFFNSSWWWVWPLLMMVVCFFMMKRWRGPMMCGFGTRSNDRQQSKSSDSAADILAKRFAVGEIDKLEYEEMKRTLGFQSNEAEV